MKHLTWNEPALNVILLAGDVIVTSIETSPLDKTPGTTVVPFPGASQNP